MFEVDNIFTAGNAIAAIILNITAFLLSLLFYYIPALRKWHESLSEGWKPGFFALVSFVVAAGIGLVSYLGWFDLVTPGLEGILVLVAAWILSLASTQGTYSAFVRPRKNGVVTPPQ